jgi:hypothetical protein
MNRRKYCPICGKALPPFTNISMVYTSGSFTTTCTGTLVLSGQEDLYCQGHVQDAEALFSWGALAAEREPLLAKVPNAFYRAFAGEGDWE